MARRKSGFNQQEMETAALTDWCTISAEHATTDPRCNCGACQLARLAPWPIHSATRRLSILTAREMIRRRPSR